MDRILLRIILPVLSPWFCLHDNFMSVINYGNKNILNNFSRSQNFLRGLWDVFLSWFSTCAQRTIAKCRRHACIKNVCLNNKLVSCEWYGRVLYVKHVY